MPSIIEGYNYDIFISYRQKDNKHDGWVTEFVDNLKGELESTFKEDISIYFDENPHDRLQETHNVDKSLEGKLKCLIFIPILSQTYCDPNSYAWQYEFLAFNKLTKEDYFGRDIKLRNGNFASRILPIRIYDLEQEDIKLFEKEARSVLRAMDFVFKTASGVNRPLKPNEDHPQDNLNKTFYSDQINKVAHAIKEIILGLKAEPASMAKEKTQQRDLLNEVKKEERVEVQEKPAKLTKRKLLSGSIAIAVLVVIAAIFTYPRIFKKDKLENLRTADGRISIAVMPFKNLTVDAKFDIWQEGLQNLLITSLSNSEGLSVRQYETINKILGNTENTNYASITPSFAGDIALKLEANTVIIGNIHKSGNIVRITANLMDSRSEEIYKSYEIDGKTEDDFFPIIDSLSKFIKNYLEIKNLKQDVGFDYKNVNTTSAEAYKYFIQGKKYHSKSDYNSAIELFTKSINIDTNFVSPMLMLSYAYGDIGKSEQSRTYAYKAYNRINIVPHDIQLLIKEVKAAIDKKPEEQIEYMKQYSEINPYSNEGFYTIGWAYYLMDQWQNAIDAFEKGIELNKQIGGKLKLWIWYYIYLGNAYHEIGEHKKEMEIYEDGLHLWPDEEPRIIYCQAVCALSQGDTIKAYELITKFRSVSKEENRSVPYIEYKIGLINQEADHFEKAQEHYQLAIKSEPADIYTVWAMDDLAYLLINNDINISEGMTLIDRAFKTNPSDEELLANIYDTKGWGLYKEGNYKQAFEYLKKGWNLRPYYDHKHFLHIQEVEKALVIQK
ncbi:MAG: tetratricopeptide repeat protein [Bacteroidales bacterium]|nr:tetratricopeptide repeat protein [Bacteroidales bacterium]